MSKRSEITKLIVQLDRDIQHEMVKYKNQDDVILSNLVYTFKRLEELLKEVVIIDKNRLLNLLLHTQRRPHSVIQGAEEFIARLELVSNFVLPKSVVEEFRGFDSKEQLFEETFEMLEKEFVRYLEHGDNEQ